MNVNGRESGIIRTTTIGLSLSMAFLAGCSVLNPGEPDWVRNPKLTYPESSFLVAVGEGDTRRAAENAAAANLSRIFESHIESDERVVDKVSESETDFTRTTDITSDINILSSQTLINIQHAEAWRDEAGRYHAVAYLNRRDTARIYREDIEMHAARVTSLLAQAEETDNPLHRYALLRAAAYTANENELRWRQLKVIHPASAAAAKPPYSLHDIRQAAIISAKKIRVHVAMEGDTDGVITDSLQELVTHRGFTVGEPPVLEITGRVAITDTGMRSAGLAFFNYMLAVQIKDAEGNILVAVNENGREAVNTPERARARCQRTMIQAIKDKGRQSLDAYFNGLIERSD